MDIQVGDDRGRAELEAHVLERLVREVREAEAAIAGYEEMLAIAQRQGMTYEQQWMPGQIARLQVTINEIVVLWPEAATADEDHFEDRPTARGMKQCNPR